MTLTEVLLILVLLVVVAVASVGGYVLYKMQTAMAIIALHDCIEAEPTPPLVIPEVLEASQIDQMPPTEPDTVGTFQPNRWN